MHTRLLATALVGVSIVLGVRTVNAGRPPLGTPFTTIPVAQEISNTLSSSCRATSRVNGTIGVILPPRGSGFPPAYRPHLVVRTRVSCEDGTVRQYAPQLIHGSDFTAEQLEREIGASGFVVSNPDPSQMCTAAPVVRVSARDVTLLGVDTACRDVGRGGGPLVGDPPWCVGLDADRDPSCVRHRAMNK